MIIKLAVGVFLFLVVLLGLTFIVSGILDYQRQKKNKEKNNTIHIVEVHFAMFVYSVILAIFVVFLGLFLAIAILLLNTIATEL